MHEIKTKLGSELPTSLLMGHNRSETVFFYQLQIRLPAPFNSICKRLVENCQIDMTGDWIPLFILRLTKGKASSIHALAFRNPS